MSDWSDYFEDFPEKNPANWVNGKFDPGLATRLLEDKHHDDMVHEQSNDELKDIIEKVKHETKAHSSTLVEGCSKHSLKNLYTYKLMKYLTYMNAKMMKFMAHWRFLWERIHNGYRNGIH